jgi:hypothetical protein
MLAPFATINFGPDGVVEDEQGKMLLLTTLFFIIFGA